MPHEKEKAKKVSTAPTPGLLKRIFGSSQMTPEMQQGIDIARREDPSIGNVQPYGLISRIIKPEAHGYTSPGRNIYLNPAIMGGQSPQEVADTVLHEQQHVGQMNKRGKGRIGEFMHEAFGEDSNLPYYQRPDEIDAFRFERNRRSRMGRMQTATPEFETGIDTTPSDIYLRTPKKKKGIDTGPSFFGGGR